MGRVAAFQSGRKSFSPAARAGRFFAHCVSGNILQPPLLFLSAKEKEERPAGVEEKEGIPHSVCIATPTGAVRLFAKHCFSCGLRPKATAAGKSRASILWHLSGQNLCVFARAIPSRSKAALSSKVSYHFKFQLWSIFRRRLLSLSAAAPLAKQY